MDWDENFVNARYHLAVAERMFRNYGEIGDKRFLIGVINEAAKAVSFLIKVIRKIDRSSGDLKSVVVKYFDSITCENLLKVLEIEKIQRNSPIEYAKGDKIILLINGRYRILTADRIGELVKSVGDGIRVFSGKFRQI